MGGGSGGRIISTVRGLGVFILLGVFRFFHIVEMTGGLTVYEEARQCYIFRIHI